MAQMKRLLPFGLISKTFKKAFRNLQCDPPSSLPVQVNKCACSSIWYIFLNNNVFVELVICNSCSMDLLRLILGLWCVVCTNSNIIEKWFMSSLSLTLFFLLPGSGYLSGDCYPCGTGCQRKLYPWVGLGFVTRKFFWSWGWVWNQKTWRVLTYCHI
jgi:hypothetical protein